MGNKDVSEPIGCAECERLKAVNAELLAACLALDYAQQYYEGRAQAPGSMPGNPFYSDLFMEVVRQARAAIARARGTA